VPTRLLAKAREKGVEESLRLGSDAVHATFRRFARNGESASIFLSPPMDNSGAPHVLVEVVEEFGGRPGTVRLLSPVIPSELRERAEASGAKVERAAAVMGPTLVGLQLGLRRNDLVLMNTVAVPANYREFVLDALLSRTLAHAYWYIHEDTDQLPALAPSFLEPAFQTRVRRLVELRRLTLLVPSRSVKDQYDALLGTDETQVVPYRVALGGADEPRRPESDYATLRFLLSGKPTDGRKGHMIALAAFHEFLRSHYERQPTAYRPFTLTLVGMTDDFIGEQIRAIGLSTLGDRLQMVPSVSHARALEVTRTCNAVICCSFNEALPVYVIEGMAMGHIVLRNAAGGMEEQLSEGVNGFRIDSRDVEQFAAVLERVLNRRTTTDARLRAMGRASQEMIAGLRVASYSEALERAR